MADIRMSQGHEDALKLHLEALYLRRVVLGSHYQTAGSCYKVACLIDRQGDAKSAMYLSPMLLAKVSLDFRADVYVFRELLKETLAMYRSSYAADGGVARTLFKMSKVWDASGDHKAAQNALQEATKLLVRFEKNTKHKSDMEVRFDALVTYMDR